jgi:hypothetical protein
MKRIDTCLAPVIRELNKHFNTKTLACCCGHGIYHETIFLKQNQIILEFHTGLVITPIKRRYLNFYQQDPNGYYFNAKIEAFYQEQKRRETEVQRLWMKMR